MNRRKTPPIGKHTDSSKPSAASVVASREYEYRRAEFLATVSHDLKNPLTAITGMSELLLRRAQSQEEIDREYLTRGLETIAKTADRMNKQITELLDSSHMQMGRSLDLDIQEADLVAMLSRLVTEYAQTTDRHTIRLETSSCSVLCACDALRVERSLANLLSNALKYSPEGGEVKLSLAVTEEPGGPAANWATISIRDQGIGIPEADLPHVFEQFFRGSNVAGRITGSGIGLAGARQIIEQHGGSIAIASTQGAGTTVTVRLPLAGPHADDAGSVSTSGPE